MNKLTIFFIIATVLIVSVTGALLGLKYFQAQPKAEPIQEVEQISEDDTVNPAVESTPEKPEEEIVEAPPAIPSPFDSAPVIAGIDLEKINEAGFKDNNLELLDFDGIIFNDFNMAEYNDDDHILYILLSGEEESAKITELFFPSLEISDEVYASLKAKMEQSGYFDINETNQYGDNSYFANHDTEKNSVFLVVKIRERLYTLHYPAKNHNKIKNLINLL